MLATIPLKFSVEQNMEAGHLNHPTSITVHLLIITTTNKVTLGDLCAGGEFDGFVSMIL